MKSNEIISSAEKARLNCGGRSRRQGLGATGGLLMGVRPWRGKSRQSCRRAA